MKKILAIFFFGLLFSNCDNASEKKEEEIKVVNNDKEADILNNVSKVINDEIYPINNFVYTSNSLKIELTIPISEVYYENKLNIIREKVVLLIAGKTNSLDTICVNFKVNESQNPNEFLVLYDKKLINGVVDFNSKNKMYRDFNDYILKNIDGNDLAQFSVYLKVLKTVDPKIVKTDDFIQLVYDYIDEAQQKSTNTNNKDILIALKKLIIDGKEWKDFNPNEIDYFLNYVNH